MAKATTASAFSFIFGEHSGDPRVGHALCESRHRRGTALGRRPTLNPPGNLLNGSRWRSGARSPGKLRAQSCDFGLRRIVRRCGVFELLNLRRTRSSPAHRICSPLQCIRGAFSCNGLVKSLCNIFCQYNHPRLKRNHRNGDYTSEGRRPKPTKITLTDKQLIKVSIHGVRRGDHA